jgi:hypothetical protein
MNTARRPVTAPHHTGSCLACNLNPAVDSGLCALCLCDINATVDLRNLAAIDAANDADDCIRFLVGDDEGELAARGIRC